MTRRTAHRILALIAGLLLTVGSNLGAQVPDGEPEPLVRTSVLGPVRAMVRLEPIAPRIGDVLTLTIEVVSDPEIEVLMPAFGEALGQFVILDFAPREGLDAEGRTARTQRYTLDVPMSGSWSIPPLLVEFVDRREGQRPAPEGEDADEVLTERIDFAVASVLPSADDADFVPPLGKLEPLPTRLDRARPWLVSGAILTLLVTLAAYFLLRAGSRRFRRSAYEVAIARLRELQKLPRVTPEEIDHFYVELSGIVRRYLEVRFEIRAPESTTEEFLERASRSVALTDDHSELLVRFLRQADLVKFAAQIPGDLEIADSVRSAEQFLEDTREDAPLLEVANAEGDR